MKCITNTHEWSTAACSRAFNAAILAIRYPSTIVWGWIFCAINFSASLNSSAANTVTVVVPSPTSSSCTLEILTRILAAALSNWIAFRIVAPSFVTLISPVEADWRILFMPLGPKVDLTRSPRARAPTNDERRAFSAFSSVAYGLISWFLCIRKKTYLLYAPVRRIFALTLSGNREYVQNQAFRFT